MPHKILTGVRDEQIAEILSGMCAEDWEKVEEQATLASIRLIQLASYAREEISNQTQIK